MQPSDFKVGPIDHVELFVPDRYEAARWYGQTLGLQILSGLEDWAVPGGPLMISSDGGHTMLALFEDDSRGSPSTAGDHRVAFRVDGAAFVHFLQWVGEHPVFSEGW